MGRPQIAINLATSTAELTVRTEDAKVAPTKAQITALSDRETAALHARMEPLPSVDNSKAPTTRAPSPPPPRAGTVQPIAFVVPTGKPVADAPFGASRPSTPLATPQISPQGEIRADSEVRVRFSQPMVAIASVGTNSGTAVAKLSPAVAGTWRWIDTRVAVFKTTAVRFPAASEITVTVPAGTKSLAGSILASDATATFATPPITVNSGFPNSIKIRPDSAIVARFDQDFDPAKIAPLLRVTDETGKKTFPHEVIALAAAEERWAKNPAIALAKRADAIGTRFVVLAPKTAWPAGQTIQVALKAGAPSNEGPRTSTKESYVSFEVAPAFTALGIRCSYKNYEPRRANVVCPADGTLDVVFSNPILVSSYRSEKIQIQGLPFDDHEPKGDHVGLDTPKPVGRAYTVAIKGDMTDAYGQPYVGARALPFTTGPKEWHAYLEAPAGLHILDPRFEIPQWTVRAQAVPSITIELYRVEPKDYFAFEAFERGTRGVPPGKKIYVKTHAIGLGFGVDVRADLRPVLTNGLGHVVAVATIPAFGERKLERQAAWIQVSKLGVAARVDGERVSAWVQDITPTSRFLAPIENATTHLLVEERGESKTAKTDASGHATFELLPPAGPPPRNRFRDRDRTALLLASAGPDVAFAAIGRYEKTVRTHSALWYVTDDRFTYKPGEKVFVKGWVRWTHDGVNPPLDLPQPADTVGYTLTDSRGVKIDSGTLKLSAQGGFHVEIDIPKTANLGYAHFSFSTRNLESRQHAISIQEFRTPAYAVTLNDDVSHGGAIPLILGESIEMTAGAKYYAGGGLGGADIKWVANLTTAKYDPPGWNTFEFEPPHPRSDRYAYYNYRYRDDKTITVEQPASLSGASSATIVYGIAAVHKGHPSILDVDATVTDVDRMSIRASSRKILVHPSAYYIGLRLQPNAVDTLEAIVTDIDGNPVSGVSIAVEIEGVLGSERARTDAKLVDTHKCALTSAAKPVTCRWPREYKHAYSATAKIADPRGRTNVTQFEVPWYGRDDRREFQVILDKASYRPGDVAKIEIRSDVFPASAVVTFARNGILSQKQIKLTGASTTVELPIELGFIQNVYVTVDRYGKRRHVIATKAGLPLPEDDSVEVDIPVDLESARLTMRTRALKKLVEPGDDATFEVEVKHDSKPVAGAEVALIVVDEAILALSAKSHADPLAPFYRRVTSNTLTASTLGLVHDSGNHLDGKPGFDRYDLELSGFGTIGYGSGSGYGSGAGAGGMSGHGMSGIVTARKDFRPTAVFSPLLVTDATGKVKVTVKMPDNLTRYRIVALATARDRFFGKAEDTIVAQRKVNARTIAPRFLTQGDRFSLPVVVQNLDTAPRTVDLAVRAANLAGIGPAGKRVVVPGGQRAEVRFDFDTQGRGRVVIQTIATSGGFADASNVELPVYEPATTESFATYGTVDDASQFEQLAVPATIFPDVGGVEVELSSTQLQSLTDAYGYIFRYPYECAEQRSGRMIATAAMADILDAFHGARMTKQEIEQQRAFDIAALQKEQKPDGGWGYFRGTKSDPFVTMQVLMALAASKITGKVTIGAIAFVTKYVNEQFAVLEKAMKLPPAQRTDRALHPYVVGIAAVGLTALASTGDMRARAERLHVLATELAYPIEAKARLLAIVAKLPRAKDMRTKLLTALVSATHETASAATVTGQYVESERLLLVSNPKTTALALDAILREAPDQALVTKLARGVLDSRRHGRWNSTQENLVALQSLRRYFDVHEKVTPNYTGKLWFGSAGYAEQAFVGRSTARGQARLDWTQLAPGSSHDLAIVKQGAGRMYYRIGITYAPKQANLPALDAGFIVRRSYTAVDDPGDVVKTADGYKIKIGAKVQISLEALTTTRRHAVALVDPLPAGFEAVNTNLATAERAAVTIGDTHWDHINMRDNRVEAFRMALSEGAHRFSYTVRATTPGTFIVAPTKAEEMYSPETFGRSNGVRVVID